MFCKKSAPFDERSSPNRSRQLNDFSKRRATQIEAVVFDVSVVRIMALQQAHAGQFVFLAEINHQRMWMTRLGRAPERVLKCVRFAVNRIFHQIAFREIFLVVHIKNLPTLV